MRVSSLWPSADAATLRSLGRLAAHQAELDRLEAALKAAPLWQPGQELLAQIAWCRDKLKGLQASWGEKLVVALVGPSGAGKSTLLNALAGRELSAVGLTRPTTREIVVYTRALADAEGLIEHCGRDQVRVQVDHQAPALEYLVLVDTPDTNTLPENQRLLSRVLERADVLLAIFPALNPKMLDNIAFLRPYVAQLPPDAVLPVLNMVDRIPRGELLDVVLPDFVRAIEREWRFRPERVYLLSAKQAAPGASFPHDEAPLHELNQFAELQDWLAETLNRESQLSDRRLARAEHLVALVKEQVKDALADSSSARAEALKALQELERRAQSDLLAVVLRQAESAQALELQAAFHALLGQRWWGPVGWLVGIWAFSLRLGRWVGHRLRPSAAGPAPALAPTLWAEILQGRYASDWPPVAEALVRAGFEPTVRGAALWRGWAEERGLALSAQWAQAYEESLAQLARGLSFWLVQLLWNGPTLGLVGWVGAETIRRFFSGQYLPTDYFRHALIAILIVWLLSFILLQVAISLALRGPLRRQVTRRLRKAATASAGALQDQLQALRELERL